MIFYKANEQGRSDMIKQARSYASVLLACCSMLFLVACGGGKEKRPPKIRSVLILGNSIVQHGPAPQIGWQGNWGMAASALDSDFVHQLMAQIHTRDAAVTCDFANLVGFEWEGDQFDFARLDSFKTPDMLIMRFSENVIEDKVTDGVFFHSYDKLIHHIDPGDKAVKVIVSGVWYHPETNRLLQQYARDHHYVFVKNEDLLADPTNFAYGSFKEPGVASHPSDKGMRMIKDRIWEQIKAYFP